MSVLHYFMFALFFGLHNIARSGSECRFHVLWTITLSCNGAFCPWELKFADDECNIGRNHTCQKANLLHSSQRGTNIRFASWFLTSLVPKRDFSTTANSEQHCIILVSLEVVWHILFHFCTFIIFCLLSLFGDVPASMFWFCFSKFFKWAQSKRKHMETYSIP